MKTIFLGLVASLCFATAASAQNEVPGVPSNRDASADENVYAPTRMDRQSGTESQQQQYDPNDPQQQPSPGTAADPNVRRREMPAGERKTDPADKPRQNTVRRKPTGR